LGHAPIGSIPFRFIPGFSTTPLEGGALQVEKHFYCKHEYTVTFHCGFLVLCNKMGSFTIESRQEGEQYPVSISTFLLFNKAQPKIIFVKNHVQ